MPKDWIEFSNGSMIQAFPMDYKGAAGGEPICVIFDELHTYSFEHERRLWDEMVIPPTLPYGIRWVSSYAGYIDESILLQEVWDLVQAGEIVQDWPPIYHNNDAGWRGMIISGDEDKSYSLVPWTQDPERRQQLFREYEQGERGISYQRIFKNEWVINVGNFCEPHEWQRLIEPQHKPLPVGSPTPVYLGLDGSTAVGGDDAAIVGLYKDGDNLALAFHKIWEGKKRKERQKMLKTVYPYITSLRKNYNIQGLWYDKAKVETLTDVLEDDGLDCHEVKQSQASRGPKDTFLRQLVHDGRLVLYQDDHIKTASHGCNVKEISGNNIFIIKSSVRTGHDFMIALSNVCDVVGLSKWREIEFMHVGQGITDLDTTPVNGADQCPHCRSRKIRVRDWGRDCAFCGAIIK